MARGKSDSNVTGILVIDKPAGMTSHAVVSRVRRWYGTRKVGHAGTLDPMATGILVLGLGRGTKLLTYCVGLDKTYTATIRLGASTPTDDADSAPDVFADPAALAALDEDAIRAGIAKLTGEISQVPSAVSAIKIDGQRAYARVRAGEEVELAPRAVTISRFSVEDLRRGDGFVDLDVTVACSSGTYIRALARDLGRDLGVYGHLTALRRVEITGFGPDDAHELPEDLDGSAPPALLDLAEAAGRILPVARVDLDVALAVHQGKTVPAEALEIGGGTRALTSGKAGTSNEAVALVHAGVLRAVVEPHRGGFKTATGIAVEAPGGPEVR